MPRSRSSSSLRHGADGDGLPGHVREDHAQADRRRGRLTVREARPILLEQETEALIDPEKVNQAAVDAGRGIGHRLPRRDRQDRRRRRSAHGPGRLAPGRAARPAADRRGDDGQHQVRPGARPTTSCSSPPGRSTVSKPSDLMPELQGRFPIRVELHDLTRDDFAAHPPRAEALADPAVRRRCWRPRASTLEFTADGDRGHGRHRLPGQPHDPEHRRPPAAHDPGARRRGDQLRRPRTWPRSASRSTAPTSASGSSDPAEGRPEQVHPVSSSYRPFAA